MTDHEQPAAGVALKPLVAYSVQADEHGCIRFARSNAQARREGANELDTDWEAIETCRRDPRFDHFSPGPVPDRALWDNGWRFFCVECECSADIWNKGDPLCQDCAPSRGVDPDAPEADQ